MTRSRVFDGSGDGRVRKRRAFFAIGVGVETTRLEFVSDGEDPVRGRAATGLLESVGVKGTGAAGLAFAIAEFMDEIWIGSVDRGCWMLFFGN
ncbi:uncharacterized protein PAC_07893 [Phialocephala subalpina]|uniref:Uncharacterized protein n=1 Tax=Phialocephala subalpina TaxID=576137 RepID=A0A1L7WYZ6_9HELO|nr:uncharacterized protein PAC_07893 [Phialocephala subalpina]